MYKLSKLFRKSGHGQKGPASPLPRPQDTQSEVDHWNEVERRTKAGERVFWLNHPRIAHHYFRKGLLGGLPWRAWFRRQLGAPGKYGLELGCGRGAALLETLNAGTVEHCDGIDLDESRFDAPGQDQRARFIATDVNTARLAHCHYDLIYALHSVHHFSALEHIFSQVAQALTPNGYFIIEEFAGPPRFQWTDLQLSVVNQLLAIIPKPLRRYANGMEKLLEGRSTPEEVIKVCPSEAIRSDEIVPLFYQYFDVVRHQNLGGTIQHLLYSGIVQNFPDNDREVDHMIDCINGLEETMIERGLLPSDFVLLVGKNRPRAAS